MNLSLSELKQICWKGSDSLFILSKYTYNHVSIRVTRFFIRLGISANGATFLSLISALASCYFLTQNSPLELGLAAFTIFTYFLLDHCDGELARYYIKVGKKQPSLQGSYYDFLVHFFSSNLMLFFMGVGVYNLFNYKIAVISGLIACIGMSNFPNFCASFILMEKLANKHEMIENLQFKEVLSILESNKQQQSSIINNGSFKQKIFYLVKESIFFPGCINMMIVVSILDIILPSFTLFSYSMNIRFLYIMTIAVIYLANTIRKSIFWLQELKKVK